MLRKIVQAIVSPWNATRPARQESLASTDPQAIEEPHTPSAADVLRDRLADIADDNDRLLNGALHHISLDDVQHALGEEWDALSLQVATFAAHQLQRWLEPADSFKSRGNTGFLIQFDGLDREAGDRQAKRAALWLKAGLVEQFPQLVDASRGPTSPQRSAPTPARETPSAQFEKVSERVRRAHESGGGMALGLWRTALGQATLDLLQAGTAITIEALLMQLEARRGSNDLVLRSVSINAAVAQLRKMASGDDGSSRTF